MVAAYKHSEGWVDTFREAMLAYDGDIHISRAINASAAVLPTQGAVHTQHRSTAAIRHRGAVLLLSCEYLLLGARHGAKPQDHN